MARLLQRQPLASEIIRDLGPVPDPKEWSKARTGDVRPLYADIATRAKADRLRDVKGTTKGDINSARDARRGEKDIKPGLNFVAKLTGKGGDGVRGRPGVFRGPHLPISLDGPLPQVAVMLGPEAFHHGKDGAFGTLLLGERSAKHANTELLAYVEGFINIWHLRQDPPTLRVGYGYPPALYQLRRAGEHFQNADSDVKAAAMDRLREYIKTVLTPTEQAALRAWLTFLADNAREQAKNAPPDEVPAAKVLHNDFKPLAGFLKQVLGYIP